MLGAEQRGEFDARCFEQQVDCAPPLPIATRMIGEKPDALATNEVHRVGEQHFDARHHAAGRLRGEWRGARRSEREDEHFDRDSHSAKVRCRSARTQAPVCWNRLRRRHNSAMRRNRIEASRPTQIAQYDGGQ